MAYTMEKGLATVAWHECWKWFQITILSGRFPSLAKDAVHPYKGEETGKIQIQDLYIATCTDLAYFTFSFCVGIKDFPKFGVSGKPWCDTVTLLMRS